ncbi:MAG TPA: Maf family nucleotide pyrophosphatase [Rhodanobacteraceae bacterium]|nr:Maf family nucleotide pyrophosphatase [Rhodanobacteraceae bacterium]
MNTPRVVLASTSRYRAELLHRLLADFEQVAPGVEEGALPGETPAQCATRLAALKARAVAAHHDGAIVIGSDQVAELDGHVLGKPGNAARARAQLQACGGREARFHTAVCVIDTHTGHRCLQATDLTRALFRTLSPDEIARYVEREQPLDCAGGFKAEALGISLFERIESDDPTALIGLPLIALARLLRECGLSLP